MLTLAWSLTAVSSMSSAIIYTQSDVRLNNCLWACIGHRCEFSWKWHSVVLRFWGSHPFTNKCNNTVHGHAAINLCVYCTCAFTESILLSPCLLYLSLFLSLRALNLMQVSHCSSPLLSSHRTTIAQRSKRKKKLPAQQSVCLCGSLSVCLAVGKKEEKRKMC